MTRSYLKFVLMHVLAWLAFIFYELGTLYFAGGHFNGIGVRLIFYVLNIALFYVNAYVVFDRSFSRPRPYLILFPLIISELGAYILLKYAVDYYLLDFRVPLADMGRVSRYVVVNLWRGLYFLGFSALYWSVRRLFAYRMEIAESEKRQLVIQREKAEVEKNLAEIRNAFLQQQINPHFLFNTLNFVYNTVYKYSTEASSVILKLADILRFSLEDHDASGQIELAKELEQIRNVIEINRVRFDYELFLLLDLPSDLAGERIIPLALLTFVENVFKHGNLKNKLSPARISLKINDGYVLKFVTWNLKKAGTPQKRIKNFGIQNTIKRLQYTYGNKYSLVINDLPDSYGMELLIEL